ncbi:ABC transporter ATP-binding protein [Methylobacillus flagellatus]|uniref:ABC transporter ATP-binding protein n=1 Tax=Methylobacillus flagellatus TaxID=405 RepID=UPI002868EC0C|nr:ABC transporter ATP-binding protein [Methylobacillus flagellatus]
MALGNQKRNYYREYWALKEVSFEILKGETIGIIGNNGSGKSTLLQLICGTLNPTNGSIDSHGRVAALLELGSGFNPEFTGRENVYLNAAVLGLPKNEINERFEEILAFADIGDFIDQPVKTYSSGMCVRLAFAVIANVDADILLIDEALAVGDINFSQKCMRFLEQFRERGSLLFVSHNPSAIVALCDRAIWLDQGQVQAIGSAKLIAEKYLASRYDSAHQSKEAISSQHSDAISQDASILNQQDKRESGRDMRMDFINASNLRNDLKVHTFTPGTRGFGHGGARIVNVRLIDSLGRSLAWIVGGEPVSIVIDAEIETPCSSVIIGFQFKNRLGQALFAQNTYLDRFQKPLSAEAGATLQARFSFQMPILPVGPYAIDAAIADGIPPDVKQMQWLHDAVIIESQASSIVSGLIGLIFDEIELTRLT